MVAITVIVSSVSGKHFRATWLKICPVGNMFNKGTNMKFGPETHSRTQLHSDYGIVGYATNRPPGIKDCIFHAFHFSQQDQVTLFSHYSLGTRLTARSAMVMMNFMIQTIKHVKCEYKNNPHKT